MLNSETAQKKRRKFQNFQNFRHTHKNQFLIIT